MSGASNCSKTRAASNNSGTRHVERFINQNVGMHNNNKILSINKNMVSTKINGLGGLNAESKKGIKIRKGSVRHESKSSFTNDSSISKRITVNAGNE